MITNILFKIKKVFPVLTEKIAYFWSDKRQLNLNLDLCDGSQKRVLISYITLAGKDLSKIKHASYLHLNQMIHYFINCGYVVDVLCNDDIEAISLLKQNHYYVIIGFGKLYKLACLDFNASLKICFITENNPEVVKKKYCDRVNYFKLRHPNINSKKAVPRTGYFDVEQFKLSDFGILMNSRYNSESFIPYFKKGLYLINSNAIFSNDFDNNNYLNITNIEHSKNNFLWLGSVGFIHKGLDLLLDAFRQIPEFQLDCYGVDNREKSLFNKLKCSNVSNCGFLNVLSRQFVNEVVIKHNFVIMPSCSEGMSTSVATCMSYGLIPILTKECGFEETDNIIFLEDYKIESIKKILIEVNSWSAERVLNMRISCQNYALEHFSLTKFSTTFKDIMDNIINKQ